MVQGITRDTRIGVAIHVKSIDLRANLLVADTTNVFRVALIQWHPDNTSDIPASTELLVDILNPTNSPFIFAENRRFTVIRDKTYTLSVNGGNGVKHLHWHISKGFRRRLGFLVGAGVTTGINHFYLMFVSDSTVAAHPTVQYTSVVNYTDM